ncbi:MAG TPA: hypothetical protein VFS07_04685 [Gemmatimonadales bacterium]|jgi:hypothetical protein|nr:hypothetical protein [Gemmatimonadales bacterium]
MSEHDETYGAARIRALRERLRALAARIHALDAEGKLLETVPELLRLLGEARSELFHYEVRSTYDTPEVAESRRVVDEAIQGLELRFEDPDDDEPWSGRDPT